MPDLLLPSPPLHSSLLSPTLSSHLLTLHSSLPPSLLPTSSMAPCLPSFYPLSLTLDVLSGRLCLKSMMELSMKGTRYVSTLLRASRVSLRNAMMIPTITVRANRSSESEVCVCGCEGMCNVRVCGYECENA